MARVWAGRRREHVDPAPFMIRRRSAGGRSTAAGSADAWSRSRAIPGCGTWSFTSSSDRSASRIPGRSTQPAGRRAGEDGPWFWCARCRWVCPALRLPGRAGAGPDAARRGGPGVIPRPKPRPAGRRRGRRSWSCSTLAGVARAEAGNCGGALVVAHSAPAARNLLSYRRCSGPRQQG
jgi:hypothetical protein